MKQQTQSYFILVLGCIIPMLMCGFCAWLPIYLNDLRLSVFAANLYDYPLPPSTTVLNRYSELGKVGNGNNCWYEVQQSMVSTLPRPEIEQYYKGVTLPRVSFGRRDEMYDAPTVMEIDLAFNESKSRKGTLYFSLTLYDVGLDDTFDIRCQ
jgi:hypothetical protein